MQLGKNIFNRAASKQKELDAWRASQRELRHLAEVEGCSFKPDTSATKQKYSSERSPIFERQKEWLGHVEQSKSLILYDVSRGFRFEKE